MKITNKYTLIYKIIKVKNNLTLLGHNFVKNNKNRGKIIYNNKKFSIKEIFQIKNIKEKEIKLGLILNKNISNKSFMFKDCKYLLEIKTKNDIFYDANEANNILNENEKENEFLNDDISVNMIIHWKQNCQTLGKKNFKIIKKRHY